MAIGLDGSGHLAMAYSGITSSMLFTMAATARHNSITNIGSLLTYNEPVSATTYIYFSLRGDVSGDPFEYQTQASANDTTRTGAGYSADVFAATAGGPKTGGSHVVIDGALTSSIVAHGFPAAQPDTLSVGAFRYQGANSDRLNGAIANVGVWDAELTGRELESLTKGFPPRRVRPQSLRVSVPGVRAVFDAVENRAISEVGTAPTVARHPRCYGGA